MIRQAILLCAVSALALASMPAHAALYSVKFCVDYSIDFDDASGSVGDDFYTSNSDRTALGIRIKVMRNSDSHDMYFDHTDWSGADAGCTDSLVLDSTEDYTVSAQSRALVNGNYINVLDDDGTDNLYSHVEYLAFVPSSSTTITFDTAIADQWNIAAAAGQAMSRRSAGLSGQNFDLYTQECPSTGSSCTSNSTGDVYLSTFGAEHKYVVVHELGHAMAYQSNGDSSASFSYGATLNSCYTDNTRNHEANSKEYQSAAVNEGIAHYYAAIAFNNSAESSCGFAYYKTTDWDLDTVTDATNVSCESGPIAGVDNADYLGDWCTGTLTNRAVEWDWLRFFWDLDTDQSVTTTTIFEIWDDANPNSWNSTGDSTGSNYPSTRMRDAANTNGVLTEWDNEDNTNGVQR
ncbi:MAG TPA: hypothetical protein DCQ04_02605 [Actinobacteria bacterium]|nr:hypothetical protein [Actinomycetota bacterium]